MIPTQPNNMIRSIAPYVAEFGAAVTVAITAYTLVAFGLELAMPGSAAGVVAPQTLVVLLAAAVGLTLLGPARKRRTWFGISAFAIAAAIFAATAYWATWYFFGPLPDVQPWLAAAAAFATVALFIGAAVMPPEKG